MSAYIAYCPLSQAVQTPAMGMLLVMHIKYEDDLVYKLYVLRQHTLHVLLPRIEYCLKQGESNRWG